MRWGFVVVMAFALLGCTEAQRYALEVGRQAQRAMIPLKECQRGQEADPRFVRIYQKLAVSTADDPFRDPTLAQLTDREAISDADKSLFLVWYSEGQTCALPTTEELGRLAPEFEIYFASAQAEQVELINEFIVNRHTFGEANATISNFKARVRVGAKEATADMMARVNAWDQEERQQTAENVAFLVGFVAVSVATRGQASLSHLAMRQAALARTGVEFARAHPTFGAIHPIRTIQCDGIGRSLHCALR